MYSQQDPRWKNEILGFNAPGSGGTIGALGCVITDIANLLVKATGDEKYTPSSVNAWAKANGAFVKDTGIWIWSETARILPGVLTMVSGSSTKASDINAFVTPIPDFVILGVNNGGHYVLVTAVNTILDPEDGKQKGINAYGGWASAHYFVANNVAAPAPAAPAAPVTQVASGALDANATLSVKLLNAREQPNTASPVMAVAKGLPGWIHVTGWVVGENVTVNGRTDNVWLRTDAGHFIAQAGTTR